MRQPTSNRSDKPAIDRDAPFGHLIFALAEVVHDLCSSEHGHSTATQRTLGQFGQVATLHVVVRLQEDLSQPRLADRVVLELGKSARAQSQR